MAVPNNDAATAPLVLLITLNLLLFGWGTCVGVVRSLVGDVGAGSDVKLLPLPSPPSTPCSGMVASGGGAETVERDRSGRDRIGMRKAVGARVDTAARVADVTDARVAEGRDRERKADWRPRDNTALR